MMYGMICVSYDTSEDKHLFAHVLTICFASFVICLFLSFTEFYIGVYFCFFLVIFNISLRLKVSAFVCFLTIKCLCLHICNILPSEVLPLELAWKVPPTSTLIREITKIRLVAQSCPTVCDPMNRSTPGLPVHRQLPEFTETHVHRVSDAIQPSHPLSSLSPPAPNPSRHQSLFQWVNSLHEVAKVLEFQP